jgi:hypothetical protein
MLDFLNLWEAGMLFRLSRMVIASLASLAIIAAFVVSVRAQTATDQAVNQFLSNPTQTMQDYPSGGAKFISLIRDVAVSHPEALATIISLLSAANADQQAAIGSGLGQAAQIVVKTNQAYASQIQQAIANSNSDSAKTSFASVTGNTTIASTGGGGGGGDGGGVGGQTSFTGFALGGANSGVVQTFGGLHYQTASQNYFTGASPGSASNSTRSVSPH